MGPKNTSALATSAPQAGPPSYHASGAPPEAAALVSQMSAVGALINLSGRQRMLSHRVVMFLTLARLAGQGPARAGHLDAARDALAQFARGRRILVEGDRDAGLPPLGPGRASSLLNGPLGAGDQGGTGLGLLDTFVALGEACLRGFHREGEGVDREIGVLSTLASVDLLAFLNRLVAAFEADLAEAQAAEARAGREIRRLVFSTAEDIETLGAKINIVALNAIIEAARAGEAGRAFAVIAHEMKVLSGQTRDEAAKIGAAVARLLGQAE